MARQNNNPPDETAAWRLFAETQQQEGKKQAHLSQKFAETLA